MNNYPVFTNPILIDRIIALIQQGLLDTLPWLTNAFGRSQRLKVKANNGKYIFHPAVWKEGNDYEPMFPDSTLGNFCFFKLNDPQEVDWPNAIAGRVKYNLSIIFWYDSSTTGYGLERNTEATKAAILSALKGGFLLTEGSITINKIWEDAENVYREYNIDQIDEQYAMQPYACLRLDCSIVADAPCEVPYVEVVK